jgi:transposase
MPNDLPPWFAVYQQTQRWLQAGCFEALVHNLRAMLRMKDGRPPEPTVAIIDSRTLRSTPESGTRAGYDGAKRKRGFVLLPRRWVVERSFAWATRCRRLAKDYERYAATLAGLHVVAFSCFMMKQAALLIPGD